MGELVRLNRNVSRVAAGFRALYTLRDTAQEHECACERDEYGNVIDMCLKCVVDGNTLWLEAPNDQP